MASITGTPADVGSVSERIASALRKIFRTKKRPGTALMPFSPSRKATELSIRAALEDRNKMAEGFVEPARLGYKRLKPAPNITTVTDGIGDINLVDDPKPETQKLLRELGEESKQYFDYKAELFKFHHRSDRGIWNLVWRPQTYADLEEENIEEKFPVDKGSRAMMCALNKVLKYNQWKHILKKRLLQLGFSVPMVMLYIWWTAIVGYVADNSLVAALASSSWWYGAIDPGVAAVAVLALGYVLTATVLLQYMLGHMMHMFEEVNANSCQVLSNHMNRISGKIKAIYTKLLITDITLSQNDLESIKSEDWPAKVERVFRLGLWMPNRVECLERFWQLQLERLRLFENVSDAIGNFTSWLVTAGVIGSAIVATYYVSGSWDIIQPGLVILAGAAVYFGRVTRRSEYSFGMDDIVRQGFERDWTPFSSVKYHANIAQQFRSSKGDIRINKLRDVFTSSTPTNPSKRGPS